MKQVVVVGDLHLNFWKAFSKGNGLKNTRFLKTLENLETSLKKASELDCPWFQAGDWVHTIGFTHNPVMTLLLELLNSYPKVKKYSVWGNHDGRSVGDAISLDETVCGILSQAVPTLVVLNGHLITGKISIYGEGHQPDVNDLGLRSLEARPDIMALGKIDIGLFHQTIEGSVLPSGLAMDYGLPREWLFNRFALSLVGDIHEPQIMRDPKSTNSILVPGSLEQHNFGDHSPRGWWICTEVEGSSWDCKMVESTSPKFVTVPNIGDVKPDGNFYRVTNPCDDSEVPEGVVVLSSPKTVVSERDAIKPGSSTADILQAWMRLNPVPHHADLAYYGELGLQLLSAEGPTVLKPVQLRSVQIKDFLCYGEQEFKIEKGVTLVLGTSRDFSSNGAGKTTLFDAIFWAIFGRTTKGIAADDVIRWTAEKCEVTLDFGDLLVRRSRTRSGAGGLEVWSRTASGEVGPTDEVIHWKLNDPLVTTRWGGGAKELSDNLQKYLGLTAELYQALAYFSQSKLVLFSQASDSERKDMLSDLCGLDVYQKAATAARSLGATVEQEIASISANIYTTRGRAHVAQDTIDRLRLKSEHWTQRAAVTRMECTQEAAIACKEIDKLDVKKLRIDHKITIQLQLKLTGIETVRPRLEAYHRQRFEQSREALKNEYSTWLAKQPQLPPKEVLSMRKEELGMDMDSAKVALAALDIQWQEVVNGLRTTELQIQRLQKEPDKCSQCGQSLDVTKRDSLLAQHQLELKELQAKFTMLQPRIETKEAEFEQKLDQMKQIDGLISDVERTAEKSAMYVAQIARTETEHENLVLLAATSDINNLRAVMTRRYEELRRGVDRSVKSRRSILMTTIAGAEKRQKEALDKNNPFEPEYLHAKQEQDHLHDDIARFGKDMLAREEKKNALAYWAVGFSRAGVQSLLMEEVAVAFNQIRSLVFPSLTRSVYDVQFATTSQTREGELREKTDFIIRYHGGLVSYESLSGGQRRRIDLGVMLTLSLAVSRTRNIPGVLGLLILDEVFGFLDEDGNSALFDTLLEINKVVPAIYAVTHNPTLASLFSNTIVVQQDAHGVSALKPR